MCGRYALSLRPSEVRQYLQDSHMPSQEAPDDDDVRQSYNFAPGYYGLVYRADVPDNGAGGRAHAESAVIRAHAQEEETGEKQSAADGEGNEGREAHYKLQAMKWGLIPFWTKRSPDYGSMMKTINCRDDSLATNGGMWNTMKQRKRCVVICQGFYEWLKKGPGGKERVPHYVKRKDGALMCLAGLWDCVKYEDATANLYTYTVITTDSNAQLKFLHDRMPVIMDPGSPQLFTWLDAGRSEWSKDLQDLLKPFTGELEIYPVSKEVGKVGNNSPAFIVPVDSAENKQNIANFFGAQKKGAAQVGQKVAAKEEEDVKLQGTQVTHVKGEERETIVDDGADAEDNAPKPAPSPANNAGKRTHDEVDIKTEDGENDNGESKSKAQKMESQDTPSSKPSATPPSSSRKMRSATSNPVRSTPATATAKDGSAKITNFFKR